MDRRIGILLLTLVFVSTSSTFALSTVDLRSNIEEYGNCEVWEVLDKDKLSSVSIKCKSEPNEEERQGWVQISVLKDKTYLEFKYSESIKDSKNRGMRVEHIGDNAVVLKPAKTSRYADDPINVRYSIDEEEFKEDTFTFRDYFLYPFASKEIEREDLSEWITVIETAKNIEFYFEIKKKPAATITLEESEKAVKDFRERIRSLDQQENTDQELEE